MQIPMAYGSKQRTIAVVGIIVPHTIAAVLSRDGDAALVENEYKI